MEGNGRGGEGYGFADKDKQAEELAALCSTKKGERHFASFTNNPVSPAEDEQKAAAHS